jgi:hypothetical protein
VLLYGNTPETSLELTVDEVRNRGGYVVR